MIFTDRTIIVQKGTSSINDTIILYRGDKEVEIRFTLNEGSPFKFGSGASPNIIEKTEATYGQLVIKAPGNLPPIFSEVAPTIGGKIIFTITAEMIDEITEVGNYTFQIRLFDESMNSRASLPEVVNGIEIREPIASEDTTNEVDVAAVGYALTTAGTQEDTFDTQGNYNKTTWVTGDRITAVKLNKIEAGIDGVNKKVASGLLKGDKGDKGEQGIQGEKGQDGLTTAISVNGTTYTHVNGTITLPDYPSIGKEESITPVTYTWQLGGVTDAGVIDDGVTNRIRTSDYITISEKTTIKSCHPHVQIRCYLYDANNTFVRMVGGWIPEYVLEPYSGYKYIIALRKYDDSNITTYVSSYVEIYTGTKVSADTDTVAPSYNDYMGLFTPYKFKLEAHRGYCDKYPENTLVAFEEAGKLDIYAGIETDVHRTSDGVFVLMHDSTIDRTTNGTGKPSAYTYEQLQAFYIDGGNGWDAKYANQLKIPKLTDYLAICKKYNKIPYIQVDQVDSMYLGELIGLLDKEGWKGRCVLTSFTLDDLVSLRTITDDYIFEYMIPIATADTPYTTALNILSGYKNVVFRPDAVSFLSKPNVQDFIHQFREAGILVECFGLPIGDTVTLNKLIQLGIEGCTCNSHVGFENILGNSAARNLNLEDVAGYFTAMNVEDALKELYELILSLHSHNVTNNLTNCSTSNEATITMAKKPYTATISANDGYTLNTVTITMSGTDVTGTSYSNNITYDWEVGGLSSSGGFNNTSTNRIRTTEYKTITSTTTFTGSNGYQVWWYRYNASDHSFVDSAGAWATTYTLEPNDAYVYYIAIKKSDDSTITTSEASNVTITTANGHVNILSVTGDVVITANANASA